MFCNKCGAQLPDTAVFCGKCGNAVQHTLPSGRQSVPKKPVISQKTRQRKKPKALWLLLPGMVLIVVTFCAIFFKKPAIYGTWTDEQETMAFTFEKDGNLRISGKNNLLGADLFQYTDDKKGTLTLSAGKNMFYLDVPYEISKDKLELTIYDRHLTLYRSDKNMLQEIAENPEEVQDIVESAVEDAMDTFQHLSLYGTWTDSSGMISFTFQKDGTIRIGGLSDTLGADLFTYTEVDSNTLQLKADTDNKLLNLISLNLDYKISDGVLTVEIAGNTYQLLKQE